MCNGRPRGPRGTLQFKYVLNTNAELLYVVVLSALCFTHYLVIILQK